MKNKLITSIKLITLLGGLVVALNVPQRSIATSNCWNKINFLCGEIPYLTTGSCGTHYHKNYYFYSHVYCAHDFTNGYSGSYYSSAMPCSFWYVSWTNPCNGRLYHHVRVPGSLNSYGWLCNKTPCTS